MGDAVMLTIDENGVAHTYDDTYDITIHCDTEEDRNTAYRIIEEAFAQYLKTHKDEVYSKSCTAGKAADETV